MIKVKIYTIQSEIKEFKNHKELFDYMEEISPNWYVDLDPSRNDDLEYSFEVGIEHK